MCVGVLNSDSLRQQRWLALFSMEEGGKINRFPLCCRDQLFTFRSFFFPTQLLVVFFNLKKENLRKKNKIK